MDPEEFPTSHVTHFAVNADDIDAARQFYEQVFDWRFVEMAPGFLRIQTADGSLPGPIGALQQRRELEPGTRTVGFECTVAVTDLDAAVAAAEGAGGRVLMPPTVISGVGTLAFLADPSGNVVGAMRYDAEIR
jgi:predicted enzyme related to lactoylglutathione lyase